MKRVLLLAAGALGAAGMVTMAAPASADTGDSNTQLGHFQENLKSQRGTFSDSIDPGKAVNEFLNGNCGDNLDNCPPEDVNPGVLHQFDYFRQNLQNQSTTFGDSIDPGNQLKTFVKSVTDPSSSDKGE